MNRAIRHTWVAGVAIFTVLLLALTYVQFVAARTLEAHPWNNRSIYDQFGADRGVCRHEGQPVHRTPAAGEDVHGAGTEGRHQAVQVVGVLARVVVGPAVASGRYAPGRGGRR